MTAMALEPKQARFVQEYLRSLNATKAAIAAGYSEKAARQQGSHLLSKPAIAKAIADAHGRTLSRYEVTRERIVAEQARIAFGSMGDYTRRTEDGELVLDFSRVDEAKLSAIQEITSEVYTDGKGEDARPVKRTKLKLYDKGRALEYLGRPFGLSNVNVNLTVKEERPDLSKLSDEELAAFAELVRRTLPAGQTIDGESKDVTDDPDNEESEE